MTNSMYQLTSPDSITIVYVPTDNCDLIRISKFCAALNRNGQRYAIAGIVKEIDAFDGIIARPFDGLN